MPLSKKKQRASAEERHPARPATPSRQSAPAPLTIPSTEAQNEFGRVLDQSAAGQDIAITRHNVVRAVLVSAARYRQLVGGDDEPALEALGARFDDLYASMQTAKVRAGTIRGIDATPKEMGRAAVAAAKRTARPRRSA